MAEWTRRVVSLARRRIGVRVGFGVAVLAASVVGLAVQRPAVPSRTSPIGARLELAAGQVTVQRGDARASVASGIPLAVGSSLATGKGARALVRLSDGSSVFLRGDTQLSLAEGGIELRQGEIWLDAPPADRGGLVHRLGDVTVSASDAGLSIKRSGDTVTVYVTRGLAVVTGPGGRVEVSAGLEAKVDGKGAPQLTPLAYWEDWTGGMGDHRAIPGEGAGAGHIYGVDPAAPGGTPARTLEVSREAVRAVIRDGLAETEVDQTFSNPGGRQVEGWYWFTVPERAIVTSFAVESDGALVEGEVIERREAATQYARAVQSAHDPALLEWIDGRSYRARIFPVPASGSRRVVLRYMELVPAREGKLQYVYPMRSTEPAAIGEFSLSVDLGDARAGSEIATLADAVVDDGGKRVTMRRSGYTPRADFQLEAALPAARAPFRVARFSGGGDRADYLMARYAPDLDWTGADQIPADVAVVVDTSASGDESERQQKTAAAEAILRSLSPEDHFSLIALDSAPTILYPKDGLAAASEQEIAAALEQLAGHSTGGATDLGGLFDAALGRLHGKDQPAVIYIGDGIATSGEVGGDKLAERMRRSLSASRARFFTVAVGAQANHPLLRELSRAGGGQWFRIDQSDGATGEVLRLASAIKTPTITDLDVDLGAGLDEPMLSVTGKVSRGEDVVLLARSHHALPTTARIKGRLGGKDFTREYKIEVDTGVGTALVPRLWAAEKVRRLLGEVGSPASPEQERGRIVDLGVEYGLVTPFTSILALESEQAYRQQGIDRRSSPLRGVRLTSLDPASEAKLALALDPASAPALGFGCAMGKSSSNHERGERGLAAAPPNREQSKAQTAEPTTSPAPSAAAETDMPDDVAPRTTSGQTSPGGAMDGASKRDALTGVGGLDVGRRAGGTGAKAMATAKPSPPEVAAHAPVKQGPMNQVAAGQGLARAPAAAASASEHRFAATPKTPPAPPVAKSTPVLAQCSDTARRPLAERVVVWAKRLRSAGNVDDVIARYDGARASCEAPDWRAESALLELVQARVSTEGAASALLAHFAGAPDTQRFVAHAILRRSVDPAVSAVVKRAVFGDKVRWAQVDEDLAALPTPADRVARLREILAGAPDDPEGELRLVRHLAEANQRDEALVAGRRLRDRGFMSPALAQQLGDVLARHGFADDALRTYSEIVEFDASSAESRRLLGDIYLRNGWYAPAYRQYKTLTDIAPSDPLGWLRLAASAAGSGRVDEALRLSRQVATAEGTPGPNDPRAWARLWSAARLGSLLADATHPKEGAALEPAMIESLGRKLKELQLFAGPAALCILTWDDLGASLSLAASDKASLGDATDASPIGLVAHAVPAADASRAWVVRWKSDAPGRDVPFTLRTLIWDGKTFEVRVRTGSLAAADKETAVP